MRNVFILLSFVTLIVLGGCGEKETPQEIVIRDYLTKEGTENIDCWMKEIKEKFSNDEITKLVDISLNKADLFNEDEIFSKIMAIGFICENK